MNELRATFSEASTLARVIYGTLPGARSLVTSATPPHQRGDKVEGYLNFLLASEAPRALRRQSKTNLHHLVGNVTLAVETLSRDLDWPTRERLVRSIFASPGDSSLDLFYRRGPLPDGLVDAILGRGLSYRKSLAAAKGDYGSEQVHLDPKNFQMATPYRDLNAAFEHLNLPRGTRFVDLGCGEGAVGLVAGLFFPHIRFLGLELVPERIQEAERVARGLDLESVRYERFNLGDTSRALPPADWYFAFNPTSAETSRKLAETLNAIGCERRVHILITRNSETLIEALHAFDPIDHFETRWTEFTVLRSSGEG